MRTPDGPDAAPESVGCGLGVDPRRVGAVLDQVELGASADRRVGGYSLGMRQRLGLAAALLGEPSVLVLDEPGNGLDPAAQAWLRRLVREQASRGRTVLVSTHLLSEVSATADRVLVIAGGAAGRRHDPRPA